MSINQLSRKALQKMAPYSVTPRVQGGESLYLNANENPYPYPYTLKESSYNRYPEPQPQELIRRYAHFLGVNDENILVSLGGDESIELIIKAFCEPQQDYLLYAPPTFGMYQVTCDVMGVETIQVPLRDDFSLDVEQILAQIEQVKVIFLCNPNNPTGNIISEEAITTILEAARGRAIVVLDEAYIEFSTAKSFVDRIDEYPHLAIIRTLSKAFGLAGIRCGFTVGSAELISILQKVIAPYPLPVPVIAIGEEALSDRGVAHMEASLSKIIEERDVLAAALEKLPIVERVYPSEANWLLVKVDDAQALFDALLEKNIHVRNQSNIAGIEGTLRVTIGTREQNRVLLNAIQSFIKN